MNFILQTSGEFPNPYDASSNASWGVQEFSYSLDGNANVTISSRTMDAAGGNTTLTGLAIGNHSIVVYGKRWLYYGLYFGGTYDSFSSPTIQFNVTAQQQDSTSPSGKNPVDGTMKTQVFRIIGVIVFVGVIVKVSSAVGVSVTVAEIVDVTSRLSVGVIVLVKVIVVVGVILGLAVGVLV